MPGCISGDTRKLDIVSVFEAVGAHANNKINDAELLAILACPLDKQPVKREGDYLVCQECQRPALGTIYCADHVPVSSARPAEPAPPPPPPYATQSAVTPPFDPGIDEQFMFYPTRAQMDPGSIWLRNIMLGIGREMERDRRKA